MMPEEFLLSELDDKALVSETISSSGWLLPHKIRGNLLFSMLLYFMSFLASFALIAIVSLDSYLYSLDSFKMTGTFYNE